MENKLLRSKMKLYWHRQLDYLSCTLNNERFYIYFVQDMFAYKYRKIQNLLFVLWDDLEMHFYAE